MPKWFTTGATAPRDHLDRAITLKDYIERITTTSMSDPAGIRGLPSPIWGSPEVEGRALCKIHDIKLHFVEKRIINKGSASEQVVLMHTIIDGSGSRPVDQDKIDHHDQKMIHILNNGNLRFDPLSYKLENVEEHALNPYGQLSDDEVFLSYDKIKRDKQRDKDIEKVRESITNLHAEVQDKFKGINEAYNVLSISRKQDLYFQDLCNFAGSPSHALPRLCEIANLLKKSDNKTVIDLITKNKINLKKISRQLVPIIHDYSSRLCSNGRSPGDLCAELYLYILQHSLIKGQSESLARDKILSSFLPPNPKRPQKPSILPPNPKRPQEPSIIAAISGSLMCGNTKAFLELSKFFSHMIKNGVLTEERIVEALGAKETDHHDSKQKMACKSLSFYERVEIAYDDHDNEFSKKKGTRLQDKPEFIKALTIFYQHGLIRENNEGKGLVDMLNKKIEEADERTKEESKELAKSSKGKNSPAESYSTGSTYVQGYKIDKKGHGTVRVERHDKSQSRGDPR